MAVIQSRAARNPTDNDLEAPRQRRRRHKPEHGTNTRAALPGRRLLFRGDFGKAQRTLIGHFRHDVGHYYWDQLVKGRRTDECRAVFGNHDNPTYAEPMDKYHEQCARADWAAHFISTYASMHPWEDSAECRATYLVMKSSLDTASHMNFDWRAQPLNAPLEYQLQRYPEIGIVLNELNRCLGLLDGLPKVFIPPVVEKLKFIYEMVRLGRAENGASTVLVPCNWLLPNKESSRRSGSRSLFANFVLIAINLFFHSFSRSARILCEFGRDDRIH